MTAARNGSPVCGMLVAGGFCTQRPRQLPDKLETCRHGGQPRAVPSSKSESPSDGTFAVPAARSVGRLDSPLACYRSA